MPSQITEVFAEADQRCCALAPGLFFSKPNYYWPSPPAAAGSKKLALVAPFFSGYRWAFSQ